MTLHIRHGVPWFYIFFSASKWYVKYEDLRTKSTNFDATTHTIRTIGQEIACTIAQMRPTGAVKMFHYEPLGTIKITGSSQKHQKKTHIKIRKKKIKLPAKLQNSNIMAGQMMQACNEKDVE